MRTRLGFLAVAVLAACGSSSKGTDSSTPVTTTNTVTDSGTPTPVPTPTPTPTTPAPTPTPTPTPTAVTPSTGMSAGLAVGNWTFWSVDQGIAPRIDDVSADEAGNVYVAGREAVFAKSRADTIFKRFDARSAGLTENCYVANPAQPDQYINVAAPPIAASMCPAISVAGSSAGKAIVGYKGVGTDQDKDARWALLSGGADVVTFDGTALKRERHVLVAGPPGTVCETHDAAQNCLSMGWADGVYLAGRTKTRQIERIVINRKAGRGQYDAIMGGTHGTFTVLVANPAARGWDDTQYTQNPVSKNKPEWADAKYVFEHQHPAFDTLGAIHTGETFAIAVDPRSGLPWFSNDWRTSNLPGYVTMAVPFNDPHVYEPWWGNMTGQAANFLTFFGDKANASHFDGVQSMSFCDDGTLWVGSLASGIARVTVDPTNGAILGMSTVSLPPPYNNRILAVACDPSDSSLWIGSEEFGPLHYKNGTFTFGSTLFPPGAPAFAASAPVRSIQIDRWSTPRVVYFAHQTYKDAAGAVHPGGVTAYSGP